MACLMPFPLFAKLCSLTKPSFIYIEVIFKPILAVTSKLFSFHKSFSEMRTTLSKSDPFTPGFCFKLIHNFLLNRITIQLVACSYYGIGLTKGSDAERTTASFLEATVERSAERATSDLAMLAKKGRKERRNRQSRYFSFRGAFDNRLFFAPQ